MLLPVVVAWDETNATVDVGLYDVPGHAWVNPSSYSWGFTISCVDNIF